MPLQKETFLTQEEVWSFSQHIVQEGLLAEIKQDAV